MNILNLKNIISLVVLQLGIAGLTLSLAGLALGSVPADGPEARLRPPSLPAACESVQAPVGNKAFFRVYARGVQIYRWNGTGWDFVAPDAKLYANANFKGKVGIHYAGPTWESNSGSKVVATRLNGCTPDSTAIPWLLLQTVSSDGPGIFRKVTYIQRVKTTGGLVPATPGSTIGEEKRVPYTAEYYFYRAKN